MVKMLVDLFQSLLLIFRSSKRPLKAYFVHVIFSFYSRILTTALLELVMRWVSMRLLFATWKAVVSKQLS